MGAGEEFGFLGRKIKRLELLWWVLPVAEA